MTTAITQHTPGPWRADPISRDSDDTVFDWRSPIVGTAKHVGSIVQSGARSSSEAEANARLIAAAPELLDDHRKIAGLVDGFRFDSDADVFRLIDEIKAVTSAAIANAEGR